MCTVRLGDVRISGCLGIFRKLCPCWSALKSKGGHSEGSLVRGLNLIYIIIYV